MILDEIKNDFWKFQYAQQKNIIVSEKEFYSTTILLWVKTLWCKLFLIKSKELFYSDKSSDFMNIISH